MTSPTYHEGDYSFDLNYSPDDGGYYSEIWVMATGQEVYTTAVYKNREAALQEARTWARTHLRD